ncbi:hypothetical protein [Candidatus Tisiphia endosymbiont of Hybos culiciformis]|uniref:hypothetical protein n=1 Tax=Candidatus Tisiphia endosymbiont of Hybos culiciformis TaxID=3139331 RepID=UPI003CCB6D5B
MSITIVQLSKVRRGSGFRGIVPYIFYSIVKIAKNYKDIMLHKRHCEECVSTTKQSKRPEVDCFVA